MYEYICIYVYMYTYIRIHIYIYTYHTSQYTTLTSMLTRSASADNTATVIGLGHAARSAVGIIAPTVGGYVLQVYMCICHV